MRLSIDETALHRDELYTIVTNKDARGRKGSLVAMVKGTKVEDVAAALLRIPLNQREMVTEVTLDMSDAMEEIIRRCFPNATLVTDRFHVQQLVTGALQELRIVLRKTAIAAENAARKTARATGERFKETIYANGDTPKQLLARSRYLLFTSSGQWTDSQQQRAAILFREFPILKTAYDLAMMFRGCYEHGASVENGRQRLRAWYATVAEKTKEHEELEVFTTPMETVQEHEPTILNYFLHRSTNASAESFNAKLKGFRALLRGVSDVPFFLYRVAKLYA
jgi:transposase